MPRQTIRSLLSLNDGPWRWRVGFQAAIAMGLPIALLALAGYPSFGFIASLGAFTALYGAALSRHERLRILPLALIGLVAASGLGVLGSFNGWLITATLVTVAALGCLLTLGTPLGPPGPIMLVLVAAVSADLTAPLAHGGAGMGRFTVPALVATGGFVAYLVIIAPLIFPSAWRNRPALPPVAGRRLRRITLDPTAKAIAVRVVLAVAITSLLAAPLGAYRSYWVILTAVAILQSSPTRRLTTTRAFQRVLGTLLGVVIFAFIAMSEPTAPALIALVVALQFATEVVVTKNYGLALIFITPLALTIYTAGHPGDPFIPIRGRIFDTLFGAGVALLVFWSGEWLRRLKRGSSVVLG